MGLSIQPIKGIINDIKGITGSFTSGQAIALGAGAATVGGAAVLGGAMLASKGKKRKKRIAHTKRGLKQDRKRKSKQKWEVAYRNRKKKGKRKAKKSSKRIHYARKTGQPYILLASGKAKFIKGKRRKVR